MYRITPTEGARLALEVDKTGFMRGKKHQFLFERYSGELRYDAARPENSHVRIAIDSASAKLMDTWLSAKDHQKVHDYALKDMLAADRYPQMLFESTRIVRRSDSAFSVEGTLTIRSIAKPATVDVALMPQADALWLDGSATVRLTDYGLKPPSAALGTIGTKNEMRVSVRLKAGK